MSSFSFIRFSENLIFNNRKVVIALFAIATVVMIWFARGLHVDAGFTKMLPTQHEYMQTYLEHQERFGGANTVLIALVAKDGDIFSPEFMEALKNATDDVFFLPGVDRPSVSSLFTPNVRYTEVVEDGIAAGNVVPADFQPTPEGLERVRNNVLKSNYVGRLVANDFSAAIISTQLLEFDPNTGEPLDFVGVSHLLDETIREKYASDEIDVHIIGFAKVIGDITDGAQMVIVFFIVAFIITALLVWLYTQSVKLSIVPLVCSVVAVVWQLGLLTAMGFGIDPMGILVPFLVFAIGVSHGVQMVSAARAEIFDGLSSLEAARMSFRKLAIPGSIALASDTIGFITIYMIEIRMIQEMAITASLGVAVIILTNLILLPVLMSYVTFGEEYKAKLIKRAAQLRPLWEKLAGIAYRKPASIAIGIGLVLFAIGFWKGAGIKIGDLHEGVPELRANSVYNIDSGVITSRFSIGVDIITVIAEAESQACVDYDAMYRIDDFAGYMTNVEGVQSVVTLPMVAKRINSGWNEGSMKWRVLPRNVDSLSQSVSSVETTTGLLNDDCSVMPVLMFTEDHKASTLTRITDAVKTYRSETDDDVVTFRLATGNVGVMAATNEEVQAAQFPILIGVFAAIIVLCVVTFASRRAALITLVPAAILAFMHFAPGVEASGFRQYVSIALGLYMIGCLVVLPTARSVLCIVIPLALVSLLAYALMTVLEIGLKVSTLPVVALGVGIGVDYGIYIYSRFQGFLREGLNVHDAYFATLRTTGAGVVFTGVTLGIGVATWIMSPLKFQADMGLLLTFMFLVNMLGSILLLPALASWLVPEKYHHAHPVAND
ncbi:MAG: MMPL family transporter [Pseudomonadota bacterium]